MRRRTFFPYSLIGVLCLLLIFSGSSLASNLTIDPIEDRDLALDPVNYTVDISGSAQMPEVTLKLFQEESLIYVDVLTPENGRYSVSIQLPTTIPEDTTFTVVVGLGTETASETFTFFRSENGSGGGSGGGGSVVPAPGTKEGCPSGTADPTPTFDDIKGHWAQEDIEEAVCLGLVDGYPDQTFRPDRSISRLEFSVILHRALQLQGRAKALTFKDSELIPSWAAADISRVIQAGLILGYDDHTFRPQQPIRRSEIALMLIRALDKSVNQEATTAFDDDSDIPVWAKPSVAKAIELGLIRGRDGNLFAPQANTTRAEATVLVLRMLKMLQ